MKVPFRVYAFLGVIALVLAPPAHALDVTFTANASSLTIVNDGPGDLNTIDPGVIDFDLTSAPVGGVMSGFGRVREGSSPIGFALALGGAPAGVAVLENISGSQQVLEVEINGTPAAAGPPLGWTVIYDAYIDDPTLGPVLSPGGLVELTMNQSSTPVPLGAVPQILVTSPQSIYDQYRGTDPSYVATGSISTRTIASRSATWN
jgi:hypothetical protein